MGKREWFWLLMLAGVLVLLAVTGQLQYILSGMGTLVQRLAA